MQFRLIGADLHITTETPKEAAELVNHYKFDPLQYIDGLSTGHITHTDVVRGRDNGRWFAVKSTAPAEFLQPYMDKLEKITGYAAGIPTIENAPRYESSTWVNLSHTHIVETARVSPAGYTAQGFIASSDWNGRTAAERAPVQFAEYIRQKLGDVKHEPEYIPVNGHSGLLRHNPNYLKRHAPHAACKNAALWECLFNWWKSTHATAAQIDALNKAEANHRTVCRESLAQMLMREYQGMRLTWEADGFLSFEQFKGL